MAAPFGQAAFAFGELAPAMFGRFDLARWHVAAGTMRNVWPRYQGGASSRAGTAFVGFSKQTGRAYPPRLIPFQFNNDQGLALEFGHEYMRVIQNGAYVTEDPIAITGASQTNPAVITTAPATGGTGATPINGGVIASYNGGELITLAGGTFTRPTILAVVDTLLLSLQLNSPGTSGVYAPGDTVTLAGGTQVVPPVITVTTTKVLAATIVSPGGGGAAGPGIISGTTGTGTLFTANVTVDGGTTGLASIDQITLAGDYTVNPTNPLIEPVNGGPLVGATVALTMGILTFTLTTPGQLTANPADARFTQASSSGTGLGATFQSALFGINSVSVSQAGIYSSYPANPVAQESTQGGGGRGATFTMATGAVAPFTAGDWVAINGVQGMTQLNGRTFVVFNPLPTSVSLLDVYGGAIDATAYSAYTSGGEIALVYTLPTPINELDLQYLKYAQSADVMSLCCVNPLTNSEYYPQELVRLANNEWTLSLLDTDAGIDPPNQVIGSATGGDGANTNYQYVITAVSAADGSESVASPIVSLNNVGNIAATAGTITLSWNTVNGAAFYNIYKATPGYNGAAIPVGVQFGFCDRAFGNQFVDSNFVPDFAQVPPRHFNPFNRGRIVDVIPTAAGSGWTTGTIQITTSTGSGAVILPIFINGGFAGGLIVNEGKDYAPGDTMTVVGDGTGAAAVLTIGPRTGTFPATVGYFQQRRFYANTLNQPNTYWGSVVGSFTNFDTRIPPLDDDALSGNPWSVQVNGIQFLTNMPGGLIAFTGLEQWQLTGPGGSSFNPQPITPSGQTAQPQAYNGCSTTVGPVKIEAELLYVQSKGSILRSIGYNYSNNIYAGTDLTLTSSHFFTGLEIVDRAWCEEPYKLYWAVRSDGVLLSLTYVKAQEFVGWARHDTNGLFKSVCSVSEPPVDALYVAVQRVIGTHLAYTIERMDNRIWTNVEDNWAVDCGSELPQTAPNATITCFSAYGFGSISGFTDLDTGNGQYSAGTYAVISDEDGPGADATASVTVVGGVITAVAVTGGGHDYRYPRIDFVDPAGSAGGSGASARPTLNNAATFYTSAPVLFGVGTVVRMGGGIGVIESATSATEFVAQIVSPITALIGNSGGIPAPQTAGNWTLTDPVSSVGNLQYLAGATVTGLYDGKILPPTVVPASGIVALPEPASQVIVGLGFTAQLQSIMADPPGTTVQGQRKVIPGVTVRVDASRDIEVGTNQLDGSRASPPVTEVQWENMTPLPNAGKAPYNSDVVPLGSSDVHTSAFGGFDTPGQVAVQQRYPVSMNILAFVPDLWPGDEPELQPERKRRSSRDTVDE